MHIYRCRITLLESTFFSSREVSNTYYTEPFLGNYALAYAFGFVQAPYENQGEIHYANHLGELNERGLYVTPGTIQGAPQFTFSQFNAQTDTYWYAMGAGVIVAAPDDGYVTGGGKTWRVSRGGSRPKKIPSENRPQHGRIRALAIGNTAVAYVLSEDGLTIPRYIRLGKFMSKARVTVVEEAADVVEENNISIDLLLNPVDLPGNYTLSVFDLLSVPPTPLVQNVVLSGQFYALSGSVYLPVGMRFGVEGLS